MNLELELLHQQIVKVRCRRRGRRQARRLIARRRSRTKQRPQLQTRDERQTKRRAPVFKLPCGQAARGRFYLSLSECLASGLALAIDLAAPHRSCCLLPRSLSLGRAPLCLCAAQVNQLADVFVASPDHRQAANLIQWRTHKDVVLKLSPELSLFIPSGPQKATEATRLGRFRDAA